MQQQAAGRRKPPPFLFCIPHRALGPALGQNVVVVSTGWRADRAWSIVSLVKWSDILARLRWSLLSSLCYAAYTRWSKKGITPAASHQPPFPPPPPPTTIVLPHATVAGKVSRFRTHPHTPSIVLYPYVGVFSGMIHQVATLTQPFFKSNQYPDRPKLLLLVLRVEGSYLYAVP